MVIATQSGIRHNACIAGGVVLPGATAAAQPLDAARVAQLFEVLLLQPVRLPGAWLEPLQVGLAPWFSILLLSLRPCFVLLLHFVSRICSLSLSLSLQPLSQVSIIINKASSSSRHRSSVSEATFSAWLLA